jgi:hypothetical protein
VGSLNYNDEDDGEGFGFGVLLGAVLSVIGWLLLLKVLGVI